jgi:hypothetical protein
VRVSDDAIAQYCDDHQEQIRSSPDPISVIRHLDRAADHGHDCVECVTVQERLNDPTLGLFINTNGRG